MGIALDYRDRPIPLLDGKRKRRAQGIPGVCPGGYRTHPYEIGHPAANEPIVDITKPPYNIAGDPYYFRERDTIYGGRLDGALPQLLARSGLAELLAQRNEVLKPDGYELYVRDAMRRRLTQVDGRKQFEIRVRKNHPRWSDELVMKEVNTYWAVPPATDAELETYSPPPHLAGAVDLTIRNLETKEMVEMGSVFDDVDTSAFPDHFERICNAKKGRERTPTYTEEAAQLYRRILYWLFEDPSYSLDQSMSVNATEIWHVSHGDQLWARYKSTPNNLVKARYPLAKLDI